MTRIHSIACSLAVAGIAVISNVASAQVGTPRNYTAPYTFTPPVIDGTIADGEWDAAPVAGGWHILRRPEADIDNQNTRFRMMWDDKFLYVLVQSDYANWSPAANNTTVFVPGQQVQGISFGADNINFYIDPNLDGEEALRADGEVDGYQIAWNQLMGEGSLRTNSAGIQEINNTGLFQEAHLNTGFGNNGRWQGLRRSSFVQNHDGTGGRLELALAWADLDAPDRSQFTGEPTSFPTDEGTLHPRRPDAGDRWTFNVSRISSDPDNFLPIWSWHGAQSFTFAPHGVIEFAGGPRRYDVQYTSLAPVIDGVISESEWDAVPFSTNWHMLRQAVTAVDTENTRFKALWDSTNLYLLVVSDKTSWPEANGVTAPFIPGAQNQGISFGEDNINFYVDPNADGEINQRGGNEVDAYQMAWNLRSGRGSLGADEAGTQTYNNTGLFLENHINTGFGNNGVWQGLRKSSFVQNFGSTGGVLEFAMSWADLDSPSTNEFPDGLPADTGTVHTRPPKNGEEWIFNIGRISSNPDNFLPIWSWQPSQSFTFAPHGFLRFIGGPRTYEAQFTTVPPTIDGVANPGEWNFAQNDGGNWHVLRQSSNVADSENTRFRVLWDQTHVYFLILSDKTSWSPGTGSSQPFVPGTQVQGINFNADNVNIYLDPNADNEGNFRPNSEVDGYQIAWNLLEGQGSFSDDGSGGRTISNTGLFLEDHLNTPFGNQGNWQGPGSSHFVQNLGAEGGVVEFALAWKDLNAPRTNDFPDGILPEGIDIGTAHPEAPDNNETWIFNMARISSDSANFLPVWSWHEFQSFAVAPHGDLVFVGRPNPRILSASRNAGGFTLTFSSILNAAYDIEYSSNLTSWTVIGQGIVGTGQPVEFTDADSTRQSANSGYYRLVLR